MWDRGCLICFVDFFSINLTVVFIKIKCILYASKCSYKKQLRNTFFKLVVKFFLILGPRLNSSILITELNISL